jgi:hypothetical protein
LVRELSWLGTLQKSRLPLQFFYVAPAGLLLILGGPVIVTLIIFELFITFDERTGNFTSGDRLACFFVTVHVICDIMIWCAYGVTQNGKLCEMAGSIFTVPDKKEFWPHFLALIAFPFSTAVTPSGPQRFVSPIVVDIAFQLVVFVLLNVGFFSFGFLGIIVVLCLVALPLLSNVSERETWDLGHTKLFGRIKIPCEIHICFMALLIAFFPDIGHLTTFIRASCSSITLFYVANMSVYRARHLLLEQHLELPTAVSTSQKTS